MLSDLFNSKYIYSKTYLLIWGGRGGDCRFVPIGKKLHSWSYRNLTTVQQEKKKKDFWGGSVHVWAFIVEMGLCGKCVCPFLLLLGGSFQLYSWGEAPQDVLFHIPSGWNNTVYVVDFIKLLLLFFLTVQCHDQTTAFSQIYIDTNPLHIHGAIKVHPLLGCTSSSVSCKWDVPVYKKICWQIDKNNKAIKRWFCISITLTARSI